MKESKRKREEKESVQMMRGGGQDRMLIQNLKHRKYSFPVIDDHILFPENLFYLAHNKFVPPFPPQKNGKRNNLI